MLSARKSIRATLTAYGVGEPSKEMNLAVTSRQLLFERFSSGMKTSPSKPFFFVWQQGVNFFKHPGQWTFCYYFIFPLWNSINFVYSRICKRVIQSIFQANQTTFVISLPPNVLRLGTVNTKSAEFTKRGNQTPSLHSLFIPLSLFRPLPPPFALPGPSPSPRLIFSSFSPPPSPS